MKHFTQSLAAALALTAFACDADEPKNSKAVNDSTAKTEDLTKLSKEELAKKLDKEAYYVCIMGGTEKPFQNKYWNHHEEGLYVDVISGKPLFASSTKFDSKSGWPSFFEPLDKSEIVEVRDNSHGMVRIEVRSKSSNAHLGHVFDDGPKPTGLRYCINSAALKFVPKDKLKEAGLEKYASLLEGKKEQK
jgi:peptide-methionine (R)-S-oxide reductase